MDLNGVEFKQKKTYTRTQEKKTNSSIYYIGSILGRFCVCECECEFE